MRKYNNVARLRHFCGCNSIGTIFGSFGSSPSLGWRGFIASTSPALPARCVIGVISRSYFRSYEDQASAGPVDRRPAPIANEIKHHGYQADCPPVQVRGLAIARTRWRGRQTGYRSTSILPRMGRL
jgi:hypothetical protein